jgi:hypothetical protein
MNELKEFDIQAPLREFYSSAQMNVVKTILMNLVNYSKKYRVHILTN